MSEERIEYIKITKPSKKVEFLLDFLKHLRMSGYGLVKWSETSETRLIDSLRHLLSDWDLGEREIQLIAARITKQAYHPSHEVLSQFGKYDSGGQIHSVNELLANVFESHS